ncbi:MAG: hypothetical protein AB9856_06865 [Cellulosilyticaceae bacterium]
MSGNTKSMLSAIKVPVIASIGSPTSAAIRLAKVLEVRDACYIK